MCGASFFQRILTPRRWLWHVFALMVFAVIAIPSAMLSPYRHGQTPVRAVGGCVIRAIADSR
jgi:hypothetical protein